MSNSGRPRCRPGPERANRRLERFALESLLALMRHQMPDGAWIRTIAVVDFGASSTTFSVLRDMKVRLQRDFAFGGQQLTEEIMRTLRIEHGGGGNAPRRNGGLPSNYQPRCSTRSSTT